MKNKKRKHRRHRFKLKKDIQKLLIILLTFVIGTAGFLFVINRWENNKFAEDEPSENTNVYAEKVRVNGQWYEQNNNIDTVLVIGLDKYESERKESGYINDQQADFLLLVSIDRAKGSVSFLQINRDTMTDVSILGIGGKEAKSDTMQIALAHTYGSGGSDSCLNTTKAVTNLLYGVKIDHYVAMTMDAVEGINDAIGGVTVKVNDDFSNVDNTLIKGEQITLKGNHALNFVRARQGMSEATNLNRMERQRQYLNAFVNQIKAFYNENGDDELVDVFVDESAYMTTDYSISQIKSLISSICDYDFGNVTSIAGEAKQGEEFMEFYVDDDKLKETVIDNYFVVSSID